MKYIITESRLDRLVQNFISNHVGQLELHLHPDFGESYVWYTDSKDNKVFEISRSSAGVGLGVLESMFKLVKGMFSLSDYDANNAFSKWMEDNKGLDSFDGVYTFEND